MLEEERTQKQQSKKRRRKGWFDATDAANTALFLAGFIGIWQLVFILGIWPKTLLPSPATVAITISTLITNSSANSSLSAGIGVTLVRLVAGFVISIGVGGAIGLVMFKFRGFGKTMSSFAVGLLTFPSIAWVPFAILLLGFNDLAIMFVVIMASIFSVMITTYSSIRSIPPIYLRAATNMGAKGFNLFRYVMIPAATPSLILGVRQAWSFAWHALIGAEMLITTVLYGTRYYGLGHVLSAGRDFNDMSQIIATMVAIFAIGVIFDRVIFRKIEEKVRARWGLDAHSDGGQ